MDSDTKGFLIGIVFVVTVIFLGAIYAGYQRTQRCLAALGANNQVVAQEVCK